MKSILYKFIFSALIVGVCFFFKYVYKENIESLDSLILFFTATKLLVIKNFNILLFFIIYIFPPLQFAILFTLAVVKTTPKGYRFKSNQYDFVYPFFFGEIFIYFIYCLFNFGFLDAVIRFVSILFGFILTIQGPKARFLVRRVYFKFKKGQTFGDSIHYVYYLDYLLFWILVIFCFLKVF